MVRRPALWLHAAIAVVAYVPLLWSSPGEVSADTKSYLTIDPGRLLAKAPYLWDPTVGMGTVSHQTIGYLWPLGPYYWAMEHLGVPDWIAQRLWLGTLLFVAGAGVVFLLRTWRRPVGGAVTVAAFAYLLSPYVLDYAARISVILMPWAALPWLVAFTVRSLRAPTWRWPAVFALTVLTVGGVNATALLLAGLGPALWVPWAVWGARETTGRAALAAVGRIGVLTAGVSTWWIAGLVIQGRYGIPILRYTETYEAVARTSSPAEVLRGLGYWFFYGGDKVDRWVEPSKAFLVQQWLVVAGYAIAALALMALAAVRFRHRGYVALLLLVGMVVSVGGHPYRSGTVAGRVVEAFVGTTVGQALRSTPRAVPLVVLALAIALGFGAEAAARATARRIPRSNIVVPAACVALLAVAMPPLFTGGEYSAGILRDGAVPAGWQAATDALDAGDHQTRVYELPGSDFASYRWGGTVDPITPGLIDRPYVARELVPWGSAPSADLLNAFEERLQDGVFEPSTLAPFARLISAGTLNVRNDLQYERYQTPPPRPFWQQVLAAPGLSAPVAYGPAIPNTPIARLPLIDETALATPPDTPDPPTVAGIDVPGAPAIVHAASASRPLVVAGDGDGLVDAAAAGLLNDGQPVLYSAALAADQFDQALADGADLVVTDTNRKQGRRWGSVQENVGYTERAGEAPLVDDPTDNRLDVFPGADDDAFTVSEQRGVSSVEASAYGNPVTYTPEDRAANALDGDPLTAWRVGALAPVEGERLVVTLDQPVTTDHLTLLQPITRSNNRWMTRVRLRFDGDQTLDVNLDDTSRALPGQRIDIGPRTFRTLEIQVTGDNYGKLPGYNGLTSVGIAELQIGDDSPHVEEVVRLPSDLLARAGAASADHQLTLLLSRERADEHESTRSDPEVAIARTFTLPTARSFDVSGTARLSGVAPDAAVTAALGASGASVASAHLPGEPAMRGGAATDGDLATAWQTPIAQAVGQTLTVTSAAPVTLDHFDLTVFADGRHSVPTVLSVSADGGAPIAVNVPPIADDASHENAAVTVRAALPGPLTARTLTIGLSAVRAVTSPDYISGEPTDLPVAIAELGAAGFAQPAPTGLLPADCRRDLLTVDGTPVPVRVTGTVADAVARQPLTVEACGPALELGAGPHDLRTAIGRDIGLDIDRLLLTSAPPTPAAVTARPTAPAVTVTGQTRVSYDLRVDDASLPFWLVLGQSHNDGWHAVLDGHDLGAPTLIDGYANGWRITPPPGGGPLAVTLTWTPQRLIWIALVVTVLAVAVCVVLVVGGRQRAPEATADAGADRGDGGADGGGRGGAAGRGGAGDGRRPVPAAVAVGGVLVGFTIVGGPLAGVAAGLTAAAVTWGPRRLHRWLPLLPGALMALVAAYVVAKTVRYPIPPSLDWPSAFAATDALAWAAVAVTLTLVAVRPSPPPGPPM